MTFRLLGAGGQVGFELHRGLEALGEVIPATRDGRLPGGGVGRVADLSDPDALAVLLDELSPEVIVNAAAYTAVDKAEAEPTLARTINTDAPGVLATEAQKIGAWLVHYSTDYVFDGSGTTAWQEDDRPAPLSAYGQTKLAGELAVAQCAKHLIFRTSWVYAARGANFAKTILRLAAERERLNIIAALVEYLTQYAEAYLLIDTE